VRHAAWFVAAIAAALAVHFISLYLTFGSVAEVARYTIGNAVNRSFGSHETIAGAGTSRAQLFGVFGVLAQHKLLTVLLGLWVVALMIWALRRRRWEGK
jgi:hypothetical protein